MNAAIIHTEAGVVIYVTPSGDLEALLMSSEGGEETGSLEELARDLEGPGLEQLEVIRKMTEDEWDSDSNGEEGFVIRAADGWEGHAGETELASIEGE